MSAELHERRVLLACACAAVVAVGGVRFSDGTALLAIARGESPSAEAFSGEHHAYVWDSPLKVALLGVLPSSALVIALVFTMLAVLPLAGLGSRDERTLRVVATALLLTPALRVSMQNVGLGDGVVIAMCCVAASTDRPSLGSLALLVCGLWNPHQVVWLGGASLVAHHTYVAPLAWRDVRPVVAAIVAAALVYLGHRAWLGVTYEDRFDFMLAHGPSLLARNLPWLPIAIAPLALWHVLEQPGARTSRVPLGAFVAAAVTVAALTTDVTRVLTLTCLPLVLTGARTQDSLARSPFDRRRFALAAMVAVIPCWSWSGLDLFVWSDLARDLRLWGPIAH